MLEDPYPNNRLDKLEDFVHVFDSVLKHALDYVLIYRPDCSIFWANDIFKSHFKEFFNIDDVLNLNVFEDEPFEIYNLKKEYFERVLQGEVFEYEQSLPVGESRFYALVSMRPIYSSENEILGIHVATKDITRFKKISEKLTEREATLKAVLNATPDGIYALDNELRLIAINQKAIEDFKSGGYNVKTFDSLHDIIQADKLKRWSEVYFDKVFAGEEVIYEGLLDQQDGSIHYVHNKYRPVYDEDRNIIAILEFSRDVTESVQQKKIINDQIDDLDLKNKELKEYIDSNLQLENFAYIASHDLKAPLRSVVSFAHLLKTKIYSELDDKAKEYLDIVVKSSENMQMLINDLLTYSRVKTEEIKLKELDLHNLFNRIMIELDVEIAEKNADIVIPQKSIQVIGDESLLIQLFSNLIRNALKFVQKDEQPKIKVSVKENARFWKFSVSDNGIGIAKENFDKIFGTFEKLHSNDTYEGTGLGLTICKRIVEKHHGRISLQSKLGEGTSFNFTLQKEFPNKNLSK